MKFPRKHIATIATVIFGLIIGLIFADYTDAQSRAVTKPSNEKSTPAIKSAKSASMKKTAKITAKRTKPQIGPDGKTVILPMEYLGVSQPLSELAKQNLPSVSPENGPLQEIEPMEVLNDTEEPRKDKDNENPVPPAPIQTVVTAPAAATQGTNFDGIGTGLAGSTVNVAPPDTTMAVGPNHIVQWVNSQYAIFNKSGTLLLGPVNGNTLFTGTGTVCETTNRGDPILQYDRLADRWFLSQFAFAAGTTAPYLQCIAISTTNDPTGTYYRYAITFSSTSPSGFNDYGKLGVWTDAYYTAYNIFGGSPAGGNTAAGLCASDRTKMLVGDAAATTLCRIANNNVAGGNFGFLPADIDGTQLPTDDTRGGIFMRLSTATGQLRYTRMKPNFTAGTSTLDNGFGGAADSFIALAPGAANLPCNGAGGACVPQQGTANTLDTLGDRLMYRLVYRNRNGVDSLIVTRATDPDGTAIVQVAAAAWYEIRNPLGNPADANVALRPTLFQSSIFNPTTTDNRWMNSMAMDKFGNMLMGYSISGAARKPSIAVAGRQSGDALNTLQAEIIDTTGTGSQTGTLTRWGDYATMQIDPSDDTTFWYTTEYLAADGTFNWRTRVTSYKFPITVTTATSNGNISDGTKFDNGAPTSTLNVVIPTGRTITVNTPTTVNSLTVASGATLIMNANLTVQGDLSLGTKIDTGANTLSLGCVSTVSGASATAYVIGNVAKNYCAVGSFSIPTGTANGYSPLTTNVTALGTNPSTLTVKANQLPLADLNPAISLARNWELTETGDLTANLTFNYLPGDVNGNQASYVVFKKAGSATAVNACVLPSVCTPGTNQISITNVSSFSKWSAGQAQAPTAASVSVSGRVLTNTGRGIGNAVVTITDSTGNSRTTVSGSLGYYRFTDVPAGDLYVLTVNSRRFTFAQPSVSLSVNGDTNDVNFTAQQ